MSPEASTDLAVPTEPVRVVYRLYLRDRKDPITVAPATHQAEDALLKALRSDDDDEIHFGRGGPGTCGVRKEHLVAYEAIAREDQP